MSPAIRGEQPAAPAAGLEGLLALGSENVEGTGDFTCFLQEHLAQEEEDEGAEPSPAPLESHSKTDPGRELFWPPFAWQLFPLPEPPGTVETEVLASGEEPGGTGAEQIEPAGQEAPAGAATKAGSAQEGRQELLRLLSPASEAEKAAPAPAAEEPPLVPPPGERSKSAGTPAAQEKQMLLRSEKPNEIAPAGQNLPPVMEASRGTQALSIEFAPVAAQAIPLRQITAEEKPGTATGSGAAMVGEAQGGAGAVDFQEETVEAEAVVQNDFSSLAESITEHVKVLRSARSGSLEVVLRPDAQTELFLEVQNIEGEIFVRVRLDRGNFEHLQGNWQGLQQNLSAQGVKLEDLAAGAGQFQSGAQPQDQRPDDGRSAPLPLEQKAEPKIYPSKETTRREPQPEQGWHRWA